MTRQYNPFSDDIQTYIQAAVKKAIKELQTCIPAIVKEVNSRGEVLVSPAIQRTSSDWKSIPWADITLPVYTPAGGKGVISVPVSVGDTGWVIAGDLDPSLYFQNPTEVSRQNVFDRHDYQYGFFVPSAMNNFTIDSGDDGGVVIKVGNSKIVVKENEIDIVSNNELKMNAKSVSITSSGNNITIDGVNFKNHKHTATWQPNTLVLAVDGSSAKNATQIDKQTGGVD